MSIRISERAFTIDPDQLSDLEIEWAFIECDLDDRGTSLGDFKDQVAVLAANPNIGELILLAIFRAAEKQLYADEPDLILHAGHICPVLSSDFAAAVAARAVIELKKVALEEASLMPKLTVPTSRV